MSMMEQELLTQPDCWRQAARLAAEASDCLPPHGARVAIAGCGTSYYMAQAMAWWRETAGRGETDGFAASEARLERRYDFLVAISRSGTTTEVLRLLDQLDPAMPVLAITAVSDSPLAKAADVVVTLDFADEVSVVQTRFATTALALLRAHVGEDLDRLADAAELALACPLPEGIGASEQFVFLGHGAGAALAGEAALKLREAAQAWTEAYPAMEFRHGPIAVVGPSTLVWALGPLDQDLAEDVRRTGAHLVSGGAEPMVELVRAQRAAVALATSRGLDVDHPPHLTRSVVLP